MFKDLIRKTVLFCTAAAIMTAACIAVSAEDVALVTEEDVAEPAFEALSDECPGMEEGGEYGQDENLIEVSQVDDSCYKIK